MVVNLPNIIHSARIKSRIQIKSSMEVTNLSAMYFDDQKDNTFLNEKIGKVYKNGFRQKNIKAITSLLIISFFMITLIASMYVPYPY